MQKATGFGSNHKWKKTAIRCSGHQGGGHAHLQGQVNGVNRTALSAVYPQRMCHKMVTDFLNYLNSNQRMVLPKRPKHLAIYTTEHYYDCVRCNLGRACPRGIDHTLIPGQCRYGRWPEGTHPRSRRNPPTTNPIEDWKNTARAHTTDVVELELPASITLNIETVHFLKKALLETVQKALGLFNEAVERGVEYKHWLEDSVLIAIYHEIFKDYFKILGVSVELRPWHRSTGEPQLTVSTAPLRLSVRGPAKKWKLEEIDDMTELGPSLINEALEEDDWFITFYGAKIGHASPSTPTSHHRKNPPDPVLPARRDDALLQPQVMDRPVLEPQAARLEEGAPYEAVEEEEPQEGAVQLRQPIRPNYNMKNVLKKLPELSENAAESQETTTGAT